MTKISNWALNRLATTTRDLVRLRTDTGGNVAIMMGLLMVPMVGAMGLGFEVSHWYMSKRAMQNAADAAAIAAASNASSNYDVEGKAVAALYGFVDGQQQHYGDGIKHGDVPSRWQYMLQRDDHWYRPALFVTSRGLQR